MKRILFFLFAFLFSTSSLFAARHTPVTKAVVAVTTAGTAVVLGSSTEIYHELTVCANTANTDVVYVGDSSVLVSTKRGTPLWGGTNRADCRTYIANDDINGRLSDHYVDSAVNGESVTIEYYKKA